MSELNLNIVDMKRSGRPAKPLEYEIVRELDVADVELALATPRNSAPPEIQRITDRHHSLARLLASGMPEGEAALALNMSGSRVSILKQSTAFQELLTFYRKKVDTEFATVLEHVGGLTRDALLELRERLEDEPEKFSNRELHDIVNTMIDRADQGGDAKLPTRIELVAGPSPEAEE